MTGPMLMRGRTTHARRGAVSHGFAHAVDYVLIDPDLRGGPHLFSRNRFNLAAVHDRDHGGRRGRGRGAAWVRQVFAARGIAMRADSRLFLLAQPRILGRGFNPVSFWLRFDGEALVAVIAEVNNTFGDRHSYLCRRPGLAPIRPGDAIEVQKLFHVSPFRDIAGDYRFHFDLTATRVAIRIAHRDGAEALVATLCGPLQPLTSRAILAAVLRRPLAPLRTKALIHWQALILHLKGARYRARPQPPTEDLTP